MQFNSIDFMIFFPIVLAGFFAIPRKMRGAWLLIASYYFYMGWNPKYAILIAFSTVITYACGLLTEYCINYSNKKGFSEKHCAFWKRTVLISCLVCNLLILGVFKYGNFLLENLSIILKAWGISAEAKRLDLLLPVGISFYTFQALGYIIDVYRGEIKAERNLLRYALFVSFFPQLVAGPIERSKNLLNQMNHIEEIRLWDLRRIASGAILMVWGLFMKMVISDRVGILADTVFDNYRMYGSTELCLAAIGFSIQIYCDFGGYSMIATGAAKVMGFTLMENFNAPYFAVSIKDFWNRWHISLSSWFKDYLYISLGGNRNGKADAALNKLIVFLVSGLWHGANWNFVAWGAIHGFYQIVADIVTPYKKQLYKRLNIRTECFSWKLLQTLVTFCLVDFAWVFFRSATITDALRFFFRIIIRPTPWLLFNGGVYNLGLDRVEMNILVFSLACLILVDIVRYRRKMTIDSFLLEQNLWFSWTVTIILIVLIFVYGKYGPTFDAKQFIYFQF